MTFVFVAMVMTVAPVDVWVDVASTAPCVTKASLEASLSARGLKVGKGGLNVRVDGSPSQLVVTGHRAAQKFERTVPVASGDCEAVSRVAIALISSWATPARSDDESRRANNMVADAGTTSGSIRADASDAGVVSRIDASASISGSLRAISVDGGAAWPTNASGRTDPVDAGVVSRIDASASNSGSVRAVSTDAWTRVSNVAPPTNGSVPAISADGGVASTSASGRADLVDAGAASPPSGSIRADLIDAPVFVDAGIAPSPNIDADPLLARIGATGADFVAEAVVDAGVVEASAPLSLDIVALGGVANDPLSVPDSVTTGLGQLGVRGALGRWGMLIDVGFDSARSRSVGDVTVTTSSQWLSLSFSVAFQPAERFSFDLAIGVRGWHFGGSATGVDAPTQGDFFSVGGVVSAGLNVRIVGPLHVQLRPFASLRGNRGAFTIENLGPVILIEPLTFGALLGAMLRFD